MATNTSSFDTATWSRDGDQAYLRGDWRTAQACFERVLQADPLNAAVWSNLGVTLRMRRALAESLACYRRALEIAPELPAARKNVGNVLKDLGRLDEAIAAHKYVVASSPADHSGWYNLAIALNQARRFEEAAHALGRGLTLSPDDHAMRFERALLNLRSGNFEQGWRDYESRWVKAEAQKRDFPLPAWSGNRLGRGSLYVHSEQGLGDCILAARFLPAARHAAGHLSLECRSELRRVFTGLAGADVLLGEGQIPTDASAHCPLMSLPRFLNVTKATIPPPARLHVPEESKRKAAALLPPQARTLRVGIIWSGSVLFEENHWRASGLKFFLRLTDVPRVRLYSLQKGPPREELRNIGAPLLLQDLADHLEDFADTAAIIERLDLLVMTDSGAAHVAGSLGTPIWNLLHYVPFWIYDTGSTHTPWYPSMRLFRQRRWGNWDDVFDAVVIALREIAAARFPQ